MKNIYLPQKAKIIKIEKISPDVKIFYIKQNNFSFIPGQFVLIGIWGQGEAPFAIASSPFEKKYFDIVVRNTGGRVTHALHNLKSGDELTFRGPLGKGFPISFFEGKDLVMMAGGYGIPPIASLAEYVIKERKKFGKIYLLYGARSPQDILLQKKIKEWQKKINVILTIDKPQSDWPGCVGLVCDLIQKIEVNPQNAAAAMCGPGPMVEALEKVLRPLGISDRRIFVSLERKMQCGAGKCQHCVTGEKYVCLDGPVFNYDEIDKNWD